MYMYIRDIIVSLCFKYLLEERH